MTVELRHTSFTMSTTATDIFKTGLYYSRSSGLNFDFFLATQPYTLQSTLMAIIRTINSNFMIVINML